LQPAFGRSWAALFLLGYLVVPAAALAAIGFVVLRSGLPIQPAAVRTVFWWLGALTVPHMGLALLFKQTSPTASGRSGQGWRRSAAAG